MNDNERIEELEPTEETQFPEENLENDIDDEEMTGEEVQDEIQDDEEEKETSVNLEGKKTNG